MRKFVAMAAICIMLGAAVTGCLGNNKDSNDQNPQDESKTPEIYSADWTSLGTHPLPEWYQDAKFGIFIHWGLYSVPAWSPVEINRALHSLIDYSPFDYAEWYWYYMNQPSSSTWQHHLETYGYDFNYDDFIPMLTAENYNPDEWVQFFKDSGAKYFVLTSKHHEGFSIFNSSYTHRDSSDLGPKRDLASELIDAAKRAGGIKTGFYYSLFEWYNPGYNPSVQILNPPNILYPLGPRNPYTQLPIDYTGYDPVNDYVSDFMFPQFMELINNYNPDVLWADGAWDHPSDFWRVPEIISYFYNHAADMGKEVVTNDRWGMETVLGMSGVDTGTTYGDFTTPEYTQMSEIKERKWETCRGLGLSFGHTTTETDIEFLSPDEIVDMLVDIVSKNGNLLLGIGPDAKGEFIEPRVSTLLEVGKWLKVNGESIYGTRYYNTAEDGPNVRYTQNGSTLYAIAMQWPGETLTLVNTTASPGTTIRMLGVDRDLEWSQDSEGLHITCPTQSEAACDYAYAFKISPTTNS